MTEIAVDRLVSFHGKFVHADELVTLIPSSKFKAVTVRFPNDEFKTIYIYSFVTKLNHVSYKVRVTVSVGHWDSQDPQCVHILISNHIAADPLTLINAYLLRWGGASNVSSVISKNIVPLITIKPVPSSPSLVIGTLLSLPIPSFSGLNSTAAILLALSPFMQPL